MNQAIKEFLNWHTSQNPGRIHCYGAALNQLCLFVRNKEVGNITEKDVLAWYKLMRDLDYKTNTFIVKLPALRSFFRYFYKRKVKVLDPDLIPIPRQEGNMYKTKSEEDYIRFLQVINPIGLPGKRDLALIKLIMDSGARIGEILSLKIGDMDLKEKRAVINTKKSRGLRPIREICWTEKTNEIIKNWLNAFVRPPEEPLFIGFAGGGIGRVLTTRSAEDIFKKYCKLAKVPIIHPHELRHRLGHILAKKGVSPIMIANILGHSSIQSSLRYTFLNHNEMKEEYHKIMGR